MTGGLLDTVTGRTLYPRVFGGLPGIANAGLEEPHRGGVAQLVRAEES